MTSREEAMRLAANAEGSRVEETEDAIIISTETNEQTSHTLNVVKTGFMTMKPEAVKGIELAEGPIYGLWPGIGVIGDYVDAEGDDVDSTVLGNPGMTLLLPNPESVVDLVQSALSVCMTGEQVDAIMDVIYNIVEQNQETGAPSRLVERTFDTIGHQDGRTPEDDMVAPWEQDDPTGLLKVARNVGIPLDERREMYEAMSNPDVPPEQRLAKAKEFLATKGIDLIDYSQGAPDKVKATLRALHQVGALDFLGQDIGGGMTAVGVNVKEIISQLPPDQAAEFKRLIGETLDGKED